MISTWIDGMSYDLPDTEENRAAGELVRAWIEIPVSDDREYIEVSIVHFFPLTGPEVFPVPNEYAPMLVWFGQRQGDYLVLMQAMAADGEKMVRNCPYDVMYAATVQDAARDYVKRLAMSEYRRNR